MSKKNINDIVKTFKFDWKNETCINMLNIQEIKKFIIKKN